MDVLIADSFFVKLQPPFGVAFLLLGESFLRKIHLKKVCQNALLKSIQNYWVKNA